uniref:Uncharacterized protein n=1 Tax=Salix viminalis TaxID=40686 RepID=A0A6N2KZP6_SALVM
MKLFYIFLLFDIICRQRKTRFILLTSCNLLFTNGNGVLLMRESKCVLRRSCLLLVRALCGRWMNWTKQFL